MRPMIQHTRSSRRPGGRPRGTFGEIARALLAAAEAPGTVRELAMRAQVGLRPAQMTVSRLIQAGCLAAVGDPRRPVVVCRVDDAESDKVAQIERVFSMWRESSTSSDA